MNNKHLYPSTWKQLSLQCRRAANWQCEHCHVKQGDERISRKGNPYKVVLSACHKNHARRHDPKAELICLCAICHWWYDFEHWQLEQERRLARLQWRIARLTLNRRRLYNAKNS